ncbi:putative fructose-bisphosphate aldolase, class-II, aldolase-type TIM barrel [Dioscorea sansibarensis]
MFLSLYLFTHVFIMKNAENDLYAVGPFNFYKLEQIEAVVVAAEPENVHAILQGFSSVMVGGSQLPTNGKHLLHEVHTYSFSTFKRNVSWMVIRY